MHAEITSFGLKWANWFDELSREYADFSSKRQLIECCKMSGSLGNYANIDPRIQESVAAALGLASAPIATQVLSRDRHAAYGASLAIAASGIEKMAVEIRNLSRTEIGEVEEGFLEGQIGSSSMPQKRNPVSSENLTGCARLMRGYLTPLLEDNALYHERDISHSSVERVALIDMIELFDHMLCLMADIVRNLRVYPESMRRNIGLTKGAIHAQRVLTALLAKGLDRETAYALIQPLAMAAAQGGDDFASALAKNPQISKLFSPAELNALFDEASYLRNVDFIYRRLGLIK
jgi:adenylosuccinate lyase